MGRLGKQPAKVQKKGNGLSPSITFTQDPLNSYPQRMRATRRGMPCPTAWSIDILARQHQLLEATIDVVQGGRIFWVQAVPQALTQAALLMMSGFAPSS